MTPRLALFDGSRPSARGAMLFAAGLVAATALTFLLGLSAIRAWQRSTQEAAETRANEVSALLAVALERDMKGGQVSALLPFNEELVTSPPYELADRFARGFARFPYLDSFYVWTDTGGYDGSTLAFTRSGRRPRWDTDMPPADPFPVIFRRDLLVLRPVVDAARDGAAKGARFTSSQVRIGGTAYQSVAQLLYEGTGTQVRLSAVVGFLVDLEWVRQHYFADFLHQMQGIVGEQAMRVEIRDAQGKSVTTVGPPGDAVSDHQRNFAFSFADPTVLSGNPRAAKGEIWTTHVEVANEASLSDVSLGATRLLVALALAALATMVGLAFTVRAARSAADLADAQAEFVSGVSHEMKTPLSLISLASDTLASGRYTDTSAVGEYGRMINVEASHLKRLIDNVLCYARIHDSASTYDMEPLDVADVVHESIERLHPRFESLGMQTDVRVPAEPIMIRGDALMLTHVFDNVIENAITHAGEGRWLGVSVAAGPSSVVIDVDDKGQGIPVEERTRVFEKFYRRKGTRHRGTGLGLAIVRRIVNDHGGYVELIDAPQAGTRARIVLPRVTS